MSDNRKIRLSGVAREYNVGIATLIEFLESKGVSKLNPNTLIEGDTLDLIRAEFGKGKVEKVNIREKIRPEVQSVGIDDIGGEKDANLKQTAKQEAEVIIKSSIFSSTKDLAGPKVIGKIDLYKDKKVKSEKTKETPAKETKTEVKKETPKKDAAPKGAKEPRTDIKKEIAKEDQKTESPKAAEPAIKPETAKIEKAQPKEEVEVTPKKESKSTLFRASEPEQLSGVTVVGKIDLEETRDKQRPKRGKRSRIRHSKVDIAKTPDPKAESSEASKVKKDNTRTRRTAASRKSGTTRRSVIRPEVSEEEVQKQIKETLAQLTSRGVDGRRSARHRRDRRDAMIEKRAQQEAAEQEDSKVLKVTEFVTVSELASMMDADVGKVISACMNLGLMVSINQRLDAEALAIVAEEFGFKVEFVSVEIQETIESENDSEEDLLPRPPIVTVMGHVDHGKTSLLDHIRQANVISGEAGGITQHIGAYSVKLDSGKNITFLDTPGHEAFTAMRARGANVTDVAIIIVAADDAVMPQTEEAINHAAAAGVPMVFAINKVDKPTANPEKIKEQLAAKNYLVEDWGGRYQSQEISAKQGVNVDKLLEKVLLEAEVLDLKANPNRNAVGSVIESTLDRGRGYVTTVLVQNGTLKIGDIILAGTHTGRVRAMFNERGKDIQEAGPSTPVLVLGLNGAPQAGDAFNVLDDEREARDIANKRDQLQRMQNIRTQKHITLDEIGRRIAIGSFKELNLIVKGDVDGSIEALTDSLLKLSNEEIQVNVIHKAVGQISESDILLATASNAVIVGFQVRPSAAARRLAEQEEIDIRLYSVIYDAINEVKDAIEGMLEPETKEVVTCSVEVLDLFKASGIGTIAGGIVREGKITRTTPIRLIRDGIVVYTGRLASLKRFKDDVKEVTNGHECGLSIENFNDIKVGDFIEGYEQIEVARSLS